MIFAAGLGTRLSPVTDEIPKALVSVNGKPALEWLIMKLKKNGITQIIVNIHHFADQVIDFVVRNHFFGIEIKFSDEREMLLDTGGGLKKASWFFDDGKPFLVYNVDILSDIDINKMLAFHSQKKALATLFIQKRKTLRYLIFDKEMQLSGWKNTKNSELIVSRNNTGKMEDYAFNGVHIINPVIFNHLTEMGKFSIIECYLRLSKLFPIVGYIPENTVWMDIGRLENLPAADLLAKKIFVRS